VNHTEIAWDCGSGNGQAAVNLAEIFNKVFATDASAKQIEHAIIHKNVSYSVQPSENTNFHDSSFDCVTVAQAIHWFDLKKFYNEVNRVLKPGGLLCVWGYTWFKISDDIDEIVEKTLITSLKDYWAPQTKLLQDGFKDLVLPYKQIVVPSFEIVVHWDLTQIISYLHSWSPMKSYGEKHGEKGMDLLFEGLIRVWGSKDKKRKISMPIYMKARKRDV
jgi:SAM-dependent methyltransferase